MQRSNSDPLYCFHSRVQVLLFKKYQFECVVLLRNEWQIGRVNGVGESWGQLTSDGH